jgi:hypothetical protein
VQQSTAFIEISSQENSAVLREIQHDLYTIRVFYAKTADKLLVD